MGQGGAGLAFSPSPAPPTHPEVGKQAAQMGRLGQRRMPPESRQI